MRTRRNRLFGGGVLFIILLLSLGARPAHGQTSPAPSQCFQPERDRLIREAEAEGYAVRRVEFSGNDWTADNVLRRRLKFQEGDLFTRKGLVASLRSLSKFKGIYPVGLGDVELRLSGGLQREVDMVVCFRERRRRRPARRAD